MPRTLTTDRFGRTRDQQRSRVYEAEQTCGIRAMWSEHGRRLLDRDARLIPYRGFEQAVIVRDGRAFNPDIADAQRYVDHLLEAAWFQRRWGRQRIEVVWKSNGNATCAFGGGHIALPPWARCEAVILHEVAHHLTPGGRAAHGPEFAGIFLTLVRQRLGAAAGRALRAGLRENRARVSMADVPAPSRPVVTVAQRVERKRAAAAAQVADGSVARVRAARTIRALAVREAGWFTTADGSISPTASATARVLAPGRRGTDGLQHPSAARVDEAAAVLRMAVRAGAFGPIGRRPRVVALEVAKVLDRAAASHRDLFGS